MNRCVLSFILCFLAHSLFAQIQHSQIQSTPLQHSTNGVLENNWEINIESHPNIPGESFKNFEYYKNKAKEEKRQAIKNNIAFTVQNKTAGATPSVGKSFIGNQLKSFTPSDNSIAISNNGWIVSLINEGVEMYDTNGNAIVSTVSWNGFLADPNLNLGKFDPKVLYDAKNDRFVLCILHGPVDTAKSKIIVACSKTNNPTQGWFIYTLDGNPFKNGAWTDYPSMGLNQYELFINANLFGRPPNYPYKGTYIQQIRLDSMYAGVSLKYNTWSGFDTNVFITLVPAPQSFASTTRKMDFVSMNPGAGSRIYRFTITDTLNAPTLQIDSTSYAIPPYTVCADAYFQDLATAYKDSISTGSAWVQNAFSTNNRIHFTFSANANGWCGLHYGRINLQNNTANYISFTQVGRDLAYPAIVSLGKNNNDKSALMCFVRVDSATLPEMAIIGIDDAMNWSADQLIKKGDTTVNILSSGPERWGDYSGICKKYNATIPEAWVFASYSTNTLPRRASWGNWIAQVKSAEPIAVSDIEKGKNKNLILYPNPSSDVFFLEFETNKNEFIAISLIDISGKKIKDMFADTLPEGSHKLSFNKNALSTGQYYLLVKSKDATLVKKLILKD